MRLAAFIGYDGTLADASFWFDRVNLASFCLRLVEAAL